VALKLRERERRAMVGVVEDGVILAFYRGRRGGQIGDQWEWRRRW
jgi:hypothetical protein